MISDIVIRDCFKVYRHDQDKARTPDETLRWVRERLDHLPIRVLNKTQRIDNGRLGIPVFISLCGDDATRFTGTKKQMGKGATALQSEASAIMELMERVSFFSFIKESVFPLRTYGSLSPHAISPESLRQSLHDEHTPLELCRAFLHDFPLRWVRARNLTQDWNQWIPIDWFYLINEYNGPAAGNTIEEAVLQGLCEVVERHVGSVISHERLATPAIDMDSLVDPAAVDLVAKFRTLGIRVFLRDFSLNTGIPSVGALAYDPSTFPHKSEIVFTAGTTSNPEKSICRALTEVAQLAGDFETHTTYRPTLPKYGSLEEAAYLMDSRETVPVSSLPNLEDPNLRIEIDRCVAALSQIGLEVLVLDVTHRELGVPTVYTIAPGAHFLDRTRDTDFPQHAARTLLQGLPGEQALTHMARMIHLFGSRYDLTFFLAHTLELQGRPGDALTHFEQALAQKPDPREIASIHVHIASCLKDLERYPEALEALEEAEQANRDLKEIYNLKGFCLFKLKKHEEAIEAFEKAIAIDPGSAIDYANIGSNLRELGHVREAVRLYRIALELDPDIDFARENVEKLEAGLKE